MQTARPLFSNVLIKPLVKKKETKSGILLPDPTNQDQLIEGEVVAVGPGEAYPPVRVPAIGGFEQMITHYSPMVVSIGQHVVFKQFAATSIKISNEKMYLLNQRDLLSVIEYGETAQ